MSNLLNVLSSFPAVYELFTDQPSSNLSPDNLSTSIDRYPYPTSIVVGIFEILFWLRWYHPSLSPLFVYKLICFEHLTYHCYLCSVWKASYFVYLNLHCMLSWRSKLSMLQEIIDWLALIDSERKVKLLLNYDDAHIFGLK